MSRTVASARLAHQRHSRRCRHDHFVALVVLRPEHGEWSSARPGEWICSIRRLVTTIGIRRLPSVLLTPSPAPFMSLHPISIGPSLTTLLDELLHGPPASAAYMLNSGDPGLLGSLEHVSAEEASRALHDGATVAAHVDHLHFGLSLMNRWAAGEDPFANADWSASWRVTSVSDAQWRELRSSLASEAQRWRDALASDRLLDQTELNFVLASIAHLAYHLGAIRQIATASRGPKQTGNSVP